MLSLVFAAKCSHKLGELPAGVRGMDIALFYLFQSCFSQLFGGQKVTKSPGTRENQSAGSLFASRRRHPSVEPALPLWPFPSVAGCCGTCFARLFKKMYTRANLQTVLTQWPATDGASALFFNGAGFSLMLLLQAVMCAMWCFIALYHEGSSRSNFKNKPALSKSQ